MLLSIIIPVYNERHTLGTILITVARALPNVSKEIVIVDDCSKDGTRESASWSGAQANGLLPKDKFCGIARHASVEE
jgi:cellulose synthase/poly-beta-1,6-N-acetylglucosamine synthase-like glycosyltransferase